MANTDVNAQKLKQVLTFHKLCEDKIQLSVIFYLFFLISQVLEYFVIFQAQVHSCFLFPIFDSNQVKPALPPMHRANIFAYECINMFGFLLVWLSDAYLGIKKWQSSFNKCCSAGSSCIQFVWSHVSTKEVFIRSHVNM